MLNLFCKETHLFKCLRGIVLRFLNRLNKFRYERVKVKTALAESLPTEKGIILHPIVQAENWSKYVTKLPKSFNLPVRRKRKLKRVGVIYDQNKASTEMYLKVEKEDPCNSEIITDHLIEENCEIFTVESDVQLNNVVVEEVETGKSKEHSRATIGHN